MKFIDAIMVLVLFGCSASCIGYHFHSYGIGIGVFDFGLGLAWVITFQRKD